MNNRVIFYLTREVSSPLALHYFVISQVIIPAITPETTPVIV
jgi:hypothetical protein